jgi:DnaD/phage-associated family protein
MIKDADELCVKILLFLLCCENLEKIDFESMKNSVGFGYAEDGEIMEAMNFWKDKKILDYEISSASNTKGANMDNIVNIILNISRDINIMDDEEEGDSGEFAKGLGIYEIADEIKIKGPEKTGAAEIKTAEIIETIETIEAIEENAAVTPSSATTLDEVCESLEKNHEFGRLIHEAQIIMRTIFNFADLTVMYNLYQKHRMEIGLILKLIEIHVEDNKNNLTYIEKAALGNAANGILTLSRYEEKMQEIYRQIEFENKIIKMFNAEDRKFKPKEKNLIKTWSKELDFSDAMFLEGYNRCIKQIESLSIDYINSIYINWHQKGFKTLDDVNSEFGTLPENLSNAAAVKRNAGYNIEQWYEKAVRKSMNIQNID